MNAPGAAALELPADYYRGEGDDIVVLIDNVRDDNLYDLNNTQGSRTSPGSSRPG